MYNTTGVRQRVARVCRRQWTENEASKLFFIFVTRRYASAVYAVVVCPSVRPSGCLYVCHKPALYQNS